MKGSEVHLSAYQLQRFRCDGFIVIPGVFCRGAIDRLRAETERLISTPRPGLVFETDGISPRSLNGPHLISAMMDGLTRSNQLLPIAEQVLNEPVYLHQYKINMKRALVGDQWEWHSDFWFWKKEDGMPSPFAVTAAIFLDDVNDFNGPTLFVPGSHGSVLQENHHSVMESDAGPGEEWRATTARDLKYRLEKEHLSQEIEANGIVAAKGLAGSVLLFHCNVLHASSANASPWDRRTIFVSYNRVSNALADVESPRPSFLANRTFEPLRQSGLSWTGDAEDSTPAIGERSAEAIA
jgi:ectoine hydroxylase